MGNYAFYNPSDGSPRPYHNPPQREYVTQLSLYESDSPWGPWHRFFRNDHWLNGGYQPVCPPCWMEKDSMVMVGSGNGEDYCFVTQKIEFETKQIGYGIGYKKFEIPNILRTFIGVKKNRI